MLWTKVVVAVIPATILGLRFGHIIDKYLFHPIPVAIMLIFWGIGTSALKKREPSSFRYENVQQITYKPAFI